MSRLRRSRRRRRIRPSLKWHRLQRAEFLPASSLTSRYGGRSKTPHQHPQSLTHLRGRQSVPRTSKGKDQASKLPRNSGVSSGDNAPVAARASTTSHQTARVQSDDGTGVSPRDPTTARSQVVGHSSGLPLSAKAKRSDTITISGDDLRAKPLPNDQRSAMEANSPATLPSLVDDRSPQSRKRTIMARYVFGDEPKPGERWKRRLLKRR